MSATEVAGQTRSDKAAIRPFHVGFSEAELAELRRYTGASFGPLRQIDAGLLDVGYVEAGPADGPAVMLLHGWPYDIHSYVDVAPLLAAAGLPGDRPVPARLRDDALSLGRDVPQRPAVGRLPSTPSR